MPNLRPATRDELTQSLSFALRFNGRKRTHDADEVMARITAERLVEHLERSGYVVMHKPPLGRCGHSRLLSRHVLNLRAANPISRSRRRRKLKGGHHEAPASFEANRKTGMSAARQSR
jgi:hypothetical protein